MGYIRVRVDKHVPMPDKIRGKGRPEGSYKYPFHELDVGDSFFIGDAKDGTIAQAIYRAQRLFPTRRFVMAVLEGGIRIWRKE
jgi:hypothetical protein